MRKCITIIMLALGLIFCISMSASAVSFNMGGDESSESDTESISSDTGESNENYSVSTLSTAGVVDSGTCGTNLTWTLYDDGLLEITGTGAMTNWSNSVSVPWYSNKDTITSVFIGTGVTSIGKSAFCGCSSLSSITIPAGVTSIGDFVFRDCSNLSSITIPAGVTSIGSSAFSYCTSLSSITIPDGVTSIGSSAFNNCTSLSSITIPAGVKSIGSYAFDDCTSLSSITIPDGVTSIDLGAFWGCSSLSSITIPAGVKSIGDYAFSDCSSLSSISIPNSVISIGEVAFSSCIKLTDVYYSGTSAQWRNISIRSTGNTSLTSATKHYNVKAHGYCGGEGDGTNLQWILYNDGLLEIVGTGAMKDYRVSPTPWHSYKTSIKSLSIGNGVTTIGKSAFYMYSDITGKLTIPDSVTAIGNDAFTGCDGFTGELMIPYSVTSIGAGAFQACSGFTGKLTIPNSVTTIGNYAFDCCTGFIGNLIIPDSVISIGNGTFYNCSGLESVTIGNSVTSIGTYAFQGCSSLNDICIDKVEGTISGAPWGSNISPTVTWLRTLVCSSDNSIYKPTGVTPAVKVVEYKGETLIGTLTNNTDYTVSYSNNISAGTGNYIVSFKGDYTGASRYTGTFIISPKNSSALDIASISNQTYTGSEIKPEPTVTDSDV